MNAMMRYAGMGGLGDPPDPWSYGGLDIPDGPAHGAPSTNPSSPPWWAVIGPSIITTAGKDIQAVFGNQYQQQTMPLRTNNGFTVPAGYTYNAAGQLVPLGALNSGSGTFGAGLEKFVTDNWIILALAAGVLFFPGFTRRR